MRSFYVRTKAFKRILLSLAGFVFMTVFLMSILSFRHVVDNMKAEEFRILQNKAYTISADLDTQIKDMQKIVLNIARIKAFSFDEIQANKYQEIDVVERLEDYTNTFGITSNFFVKYADYDNCFTSGGYTKPLQLYVKKMLGKENPALMELLDSLCLESKKRMVLYEEERGTLFLFPMQVYAAGKNGRQAVVGFWVKHSDLQERIDQLVGSLYSDVTVFYGEHCILGGEMNREGSDYIVESETGSIRVMIDADQDIFLRWDNVYSADDLRMLVGIIVFLLILVFIIAMWNYSPFLKMAEKYKDLGEVNGILEWDDIDVLIGNLVKKQENDSRQIMEQYRLLREQAVHLIVADGYSDRLKHRMFLLNIRLEGSFFGLFRCEFKNLRKIEEHLNVISFDIEELSGEDCYLYAYQADADRWEVLASVEEEYQLEEMKELLKQLFDSMNIEAEVKLCAKCDDIEKIQFLKEASDAGKTDSSAFEDDQTEEIPVKTNRKGELAMEYIRLHCTDYNLTLDLVADTFGISADYLGRIIKRDYNISYKNYLAGLRMEEAKRLLVEENISVTEVCRRVGYTHVPYFIKMFQKYTGVTPGRYKEGLAQKS